MTKFELINGHLCRMVEPTPLQLDSPMPCVVRLIQDDSPMGRMNIAKYEKLSKLNKTWAIDDVYNNDRLDAPIHYAQFELIGYPVEEGSHWWALWQIQNGNAVRNTASGYRFVLRNEYVCLVCEEKKGFTYSVDEWLSVAAKSGWQLYTEPKPKPKPEPKPLLANAKVGDLCKRRDGRFVSLSNVPPDSLYWEVGNNLYYQDGRESLDEVRDVDIVYTEPLAPKGTAEWAWQMRLIGNTVSHPSGMLLASESFIYDDNETVYRQNWLSDKPNTGWTLYKEPEIVAHKQHANCLVCGKEIEGLLDGHATVSIKRYSISSLYESTYSHYCGKCFLELGFDATERELRNRQQPIAEPEPGPAKEQFEVGDWVTDGVVVGHIAVINDGKAWVKTQDTQYHLSLEYLRKFDPSEVVVDFGRFKGRVKKYHGDQVRVYDENDINFACVAIAFLDPATRSLVESLLKAQEK